LNTLITLLLSVDNIVYDFAMLSVEEIELKFFVCTSKGGIEVTVDFIIRRISKLLTTNL